MKIIQKGIYTGDILETALNNRNIADLELFLNPENAPESDPLKFKRANEGRKLLLHHLKNRHPIVIVVDADADGYTSSAIMYQYIMDLYPESEIYYIVHDGKAHGLTDNVMKEIEEIEPKLVITPDGASNDVEKIEELENKGINVLVIDHHHVSKFTDKGVIVNNQLCEHTNKNLVGAGVVYKFLQGIDVELGTNHVEKYLDLVAVGQIGDSSDIADPEIRKLVLKGIDNLQNKFLKVAMSQDVGLVKELSPKDFSFSVIPLINAVTRVGTIEEREILFEALAGIGDNRIFTVEKKKKNKNTGKFDNVLIDFNLFEYAYDICTKAKNRQAAIVKKLVPIIEESIINDSGILIAFTGDNEYPGVTGLVANKLAAKYDKPVILLNEKEETYTGSGRGHEKTIKDFRQWCEDSKLVEFAQGHDNAFGISIRKENLEAFKEYTKTVQKREVIYEVDIITNKPSKEDCEIVDKNSRLFGGSVSEPLIGIIGLSVPKRFISAKGSLLNIFSWGVTCVQFSHSPEFYEELMNYPEENVRLNMVGHYGMNNWNGRKTPQFIIKDIEIVYVDEINEDNIIF